MITPLRFLNERPTLPTHYGYLTETWAAARAEVLSLLIACARACQTISYSALCGQVAAARLHPYSFALAAMLDEISALNEADGKASLATLVVRKADGRPGPGYFRKSIQPGAPADDLEAYWQEQFARVCADWA